MTGSVLVSISVEVITGPIVVSTMTSVVVSTILTHTQLHALKSPHIIYLLTRTPVCPDSTSVQDMIPEDIHPLKYLLPISKRIYISPSPR